MTLNCGGGHCINVHKLVTSTYMYIWVMVLPRCMVTMNMNRKVHNYEVSFGIVTFDLE